MAREMDLKRSLTKLEKLETQSIDDYLRSIKIIDDSLASIEAPVTDVDLVCNTVDGLNGECESLVTGVQFPLVSITFDEQ